MAGFMLFPKSFKPREIWWFPLVLFSAGAFLCSYYTDIAAQHPTMANIITSISGSTVLISEFFLLHKYEKIQAYAVLQYEFSIPSRSTANCLLYLSSAVISGLNETSLASILILYSVAGAVMSWERLLEVKTDLGLFPFLLSCAVCQAYSAFGLGFFFWFFLAVTWFLLTLRGFVSDLYAPKEGRRDE